VIRAADALEPFRAALLDGDYDVEVRELPGLGPVLLAETRYALVLCLSSSWEAATQRTEEAQAALTQLAAEHPSPRSWDLYLVLVAEEDHDSPEREALESDTRYARKLVATGVGDSPARAEQALRPLLPLRGAAKFDAIDPIEAVRAELVGQGIDPALADTALGSFLSGGEIVVP
jgi:hypothetical protein